MMGVPQMEMSRAHTGQGRAGQGRVGLWAQTDCRKTRPVEIITWQSCQALTTQPQGAC